MKHLDRELGFLPGLGSKEHQKSSFVFCFWSLCFKSWCIKPLREWFLDYQMVGLKQCILSTGCSSFGCRALPLMGLYGTRSYSSIHCWSFYFLHSILVNWFLCSRPAEGRSSIVDVEMCNWENCRKILSKWTVRANEVLLEDGMPLEFFLLKHILSVFVLLEPRGGFRNVISPSERSTNSMG